MLPRLTDEYSDSQREVTGKPLRRKHIVDPRKWPCIKVSPRGESGCASGDIQVAKPKNRSVVCCPYTPPHLSQKLPKIAERLPLRVVHDGSGKLLHALIPNSYPGASGSRIGLDPDSSQPRPQPRSNRKEYRLWRRIEVTHAANSGFFFDYQTGQSP